MYQNVYQARHSVLVHKNKRILCAYCHSTHLREEMSLGICPQMKNAAAELQNRHAFKCTACDGEGRFEKQVQTKLLQSVKRYEQRWKLWMEQCQQMNPGEKAPERRVIKCEQTITEVVCEQCRGEGKIFRMVGVNAALGSQNINPHQKLAVNPIWLKYRMQPCESQGQYYCSICLVEAEPTEQNFQLACKHKFHYHCILPWLKMNEKCPVCRHADPFIDLAYAPAQPQPISEESEIIQHIRMRELMRQPVDEYGRLEEMGIRMAQRGSRERVRDQRDEREMIQYLRGRRRIAQNQGRGIEVQRNQLSYNYTQLNRDDNFQVSIDEYEEQGSDWL